LAVADTIDKVTEKLDAHNYSLGLFIDLFEAFDCFDTLDRAILIAKLEFYGVRGSALNWFRSYLSRLIDNSMLIIMECNLTCYIFALGSPRIIIGITAIFDLYK